MASSRSASFIVLDEDQSRWFVGEGDPAYESCRRLAQYGFNPTRLVLPKSLIIRAVSMDPSELAAGIKRIERAWSNTKDEDLRVEYLHRVRLFDCLYVLSELKSEEGA